MVLDVTHVLRTPGERLPFQFSLDLSDMEFSGRRPISRPVAVEGEVRNSADVLTLSMTVSTTLDAVCDRCGKAFLQEKTISYSCMLAEELQNEDNDDIVLLESGRVDAGDGSDSRHGHKNTVFGRLQGTVSPVRCQPERRPLWLQKGS